MNISERILRIELELQADPQKASILMPVTAIKTLIRHHRKYSDMHAEMKKWRTQAKYYEEAYASAKAELKRNVRSKKRTPASTASN